MVMQLSPLMFTSNPRLNVVSSVRMKLTLLLLTVPLGCMAV